MGTQGYAWSVTWLSALKARFLQRTTEGSREPRQLPMGRQPQQGPETLHGRAEAQLGAVPSAGNCSETTMDVIQGDKDLD